MAAALERIGSYEIHPAASVFPLMGEKELDELAADIKANGQREAIQLFEGKVLDGRNRLRACERAGVPPLVEPWHGTSVVDFIVSRNLRRRHLTASQLAMVAAELLPHLEAEAKERQRAAGRATSAKRAGSGEVPPPVGAPGREAPHGKATAAAAQATGASSRTVERAKFVQSRDPELAQKVKDGAATLKQAERKIRRAERIAEIRAYVPPLGEWPVIVVDPPWPYDDQLDGSDEARGGCPYPQMPLNEIGNLKIPAAKDCVLWLWVPNAHAAAGAHGLVLACWGFTPKTLLTWDKVIMGKGGWLRNVTEHVVLAVKGKARVDLHDQTTLLRQKRGAHSEKPGDFYKLVEALCPASPRLEMFARVKSRPGWDIAGSEVPGREKEPPYMGQAVAAYRKAGPHVCPHCGTTYKKHNPKNGGGWISAGAKGDKYGIPICSKCHAAGKPLVYVGAGHRKAWEESLSAKPPAFSSKTKAPRASNRSARKAKSRKARR